MKTRRKFLLFIVKLFKSTGENNLITHANELTYKLVLSFFPLVLFIMSLISFLRLNVDDFLIGLSNALPEDIVNIVTNFSHEVFDKRNAGVLSGSLIVTIFTASSGFNAIRKGLTKAYRLKETRNYITTRLVSMFLVIIFSAMIIASMLILIFGDTIYKALIKNYVLNGTWQFIFGLSGYMLIMIAMLFTIILIYKFSTCRKTSIYEAFPGALFALVIWVVSSKAFSVYVNNFGKYSTAYGSIAGIVILMLWLNIVSTALLIGGQINAIIEVKKN